MMRREAPGERGAIVIEALIAALIIAGLSGALFETIAARTAATRMIAARREALLVARSRLDALAIRADAVPGTTQGTDGALIWRVRAEPFHTDEPSAAGVLALVTVTVGGVTARPLAQLRTLRLVR